MSILRPASFLLPRAGTNLTNYAVIACDQYTSQPDYWQKVESIAKNGPSAYRLILPELYLDERKERIPPIHAAMAQVLGDLDETAPCFVYIERRISTGIRRGLLAVVDLEEYDYSAGSASRIRATEGTILSRIPPRVDIRKNAPLELSHILILCNDEEDGVLQTAKALCENTLYDFDLMCGGGHINGRAITDPASLAAITQKLAALEKDGILLAVGDGNHSLATAKTVWEELKLTLTPAQRENHPARFAMCELGNLYDESLIFEPIHRLLLGADAGEIEALFAASTGAYAHQATLLCAGQEKTLALQSEHPLQVGAVQALLDDYLAKNPAVAIDYVHGAQALAQLSQKPGHVGLVMQTLEKAQLFPYVAKNGALPRKTFSMGEADDKRFYLEARRIR